jgi:hypothetical protein
MSVNLDDVARAAGVPFPVALQRVGTGGWAETDETGTHPAGALDLDVPEIYHLHGISFEEAVELVRD